MLKKLMAGRNGMDRLSFILIIFFLILYPIKYIWILGAVFLGIALFRIFSKDIGRRKLELDKYNQMTYKQFMVLNKYFSPVFKKLKIFSYRTKERKNYKYLKCSNCKETLKVPKGKGNIKVTCPKCGATKIIKS